MRENDPTQGKQDPGQQPDDGILALLDAPETDDGVLAEARSHGEDGCDTLLRAVQCSETLDEERRARAIHLLGWLGCRDFLKIADDLLKRAPLSVQASTAYALVRIDVQMAQTLLIPIVTDENVSSMLREHAVNALWNEIDANQRSVVAKALEGSNDERLTRETEWLTATPED